MKKKDIRAAVTRRHVITARAPASVAETAANRIKASAQTAHDHANGEERELSLISTSKGLRALVRQGKTIFEIENDAFAVRQISERE
jgi:hypothetical protein